MKTAIITGASSGLGREFVRQLSEVFPEVECVWLVARRKDRLEEIAQSLPALTVECLALDLCDEIVLLSHGELEVVEKSDLDSREFKEKIIAALREEGNE